MPTPDDHHHVIPTVVHVIPAQAGIQRKAKHAVFPPLFAKQKGDASSEARRRGFIHYPCHSERSEESPPLREAQGDASERSEIAGDARRGGSRTAPYSNQIPSQFIIKNHSNHSSKNTVIPAQAGIQTKTNPGQTSAKYHSQSNPAHPHPPQTKPHRRPPKPK